MVPTDAADSPKGPSRSATQRARVVEAAMTAIAESGPDRVTVRQVASLAGMSPGHVTYYFSSREQILIESLRWSEDELAESRAQALARTRSPWGRVARFVELYLPQGPRDLRWNLWNQVQAKPPADLESRVMLAYIVKRWEDDLAAAIEAGIESGAFVSGIDPTSLALVTRLLLDGIGLEVTLDHPGRDSAWGRRLAVGELRRQLLPGAPTVP